MQSVANAARGEVELRIGEDVFILNPSMENLAKWQVASKLEGAVALMRAVTMLDIPTIINAIQIMSVSGPAEKAGSIPGFIYMRSLVEIQRALTACIEGPKVSDAGNAAGAADQSPN